MGHSSKHLDEGGRFVKVPGKSCKQLLKEWRGKVLYLKVDVEGVDVACALSLDKSIAPPFASFELPFHYSQETEARAMIRHLSSIGYTGFKICRQRPYCVRCWGTRCHKSTNFEDDELNDYRPEVQLESLDLSGPFGPAAVDWRSAEMWRNKDDVLADVSALKLLSSQYNEHVDLHATTQA